MSEKYVLISGASSNIGTEITKLLSESYNVIIHGRNQKALEVVKSSCKNKCLIWEYDLNNVSDISENLSLFLNQQGIENIYGLVHVAGSTNVFPIKNSLDSSWEEVFNINLFSGIYILRELLKKKYKQYFKTAVFISSTYAYFGGKGQSAYCASKAAIEGFVRSAAIELAPNIRVNAVVPGAIETERTQIDNPYITSLRQAHPLGFGNACDIANMVEYLVSDKSLWITGQSFIVDGGYSINNLK